MAGMAATVGTIAEYVNRAISCILTMRLMSARALSDEHLITLSVEGNEKTYKVQRTILLQASSWFQKALSEQYQEGSSKKINFLETDPQTVENFLYWLITGSSPFATEGELEDIRQPQDLAATRLWIFADKLFIPKLQNIAMKALFASQENQIPTLDAIREGCQGSVQGSGLRRYFMLWVMRGLRNGYHNANSAYLPDHLDSMGSIPGFTSDLAALLTTVMPTSPKMGVLLKCECSEFEVVE
jgi:hypothetical protein